MYGGLKAGERASAWRVVIESEHALRDLPIGRRVADEHRIETRPAAAPDERFEDRLRAARNRQEPFGLAHSARLPTYENGKERGRCHRRVPSRSRAALGRLSFVP